MTLDEIKELIQLVLESGVAELEVERGGNRVRIRRTVEPARQEVILPASGPHGYVHTAPQASAAAPTPAAQAPAAESGLVLVKSPIVGTFYESPAPGSPPFVQAGDRVEPGQVLCIIESMKLMNEIEAESAGVIVARLVENGKPVEYGEDLYSIRPL
jgi:acetyl-CoA carboxylase biotin carboxyl carrier protein